MRALHRFAFGTLLAGCLLPGTAAADNEQKEPPEHYVPVGEYEVVLIARADGQLAADVRPLVRLSVKVNAQLRWNVGYQYYGYHEDFLALQNFRAQTGYSSLSWSF